MKEARKGNHLIVGKSGHKELTDLSNEYNIIKLNQEENMLEISIHVNYYIHRNQPWSRHPRFVRIVVDPPTQSAPPGRDSNFIDSTGRWNVTGTTRGTLLNIVKRYLAAMDFVPPNRPSVFPRTHRKTLVRQRPEMLLRRRRKRYFHPLSGNSVFSRYSLLIEVAGYLAAMVPVMKVPR